MLATGCVAYWRWIQSFRNWAGGPGRGRAISVCDHASNIGGSFSWEWPHGNLLWKDELVVALMARRKAEKCLASTAALGMRCPAKGASQDDVVDSESAHTMLLKKKFHK